VAFGQKFVRAKSLEVMSDIKESMAIGFVLTPQEEALLVISFLLYLLGVGFLCLLNSPGFD
jgi:hypothetical protein